MLVPVPGPGETGSPGRALPRITKVIGVYDLWFQRYSNFMIVKINQDLAVLRVCRTTSFSVETYRVWRSGVLGYNSERRGVRGGSPGKKTEG